MSRYVVQIHELASGDLDQIAEWIAKNSPDGARRWLEAFSTLLESLKHAPESCSIASESEVIGRELREAFFRTRRGRTYRAVFAVDGKQIRILRVRGSGQPPLTDAELT
jgi:plasmid stabilization system protein ParE